MSRRLGTVVRWLGSAVVLLAVVADSLSDDPLIPRDLLDDKLQHVLVFAILALWGFMLFPRHLWVVVAALALFGAGIEVLQGFTGRRPDFDDFSADMTGVLLAMAIRAFLGRLRPRLWP